jgi:hypothetical protein
MAIGAPVAEMVGANRDLVNREAQPVTMTAWLPKVVPGKFLPA